MKAFFKRFLSSKRLRAGGGRLAAQNPRHSRRSRFRGAWDPLAEDSFTSGAHATDSDDEHDSKIPAPSVKILGSKHLPRSLVDTAHVSILNNAAAEDGHVTQVNVRLGGVPPGDGTDWEVRAYAKLGHREFVLKRAAVVKIRILQTGEQVIKIVPPLRINRGEYVGLTNRSGRLAVTYTRGAEADRRGGETWDLWYQEHQPASTIGSRMTSLLLWHGRVGWYATMEENQPEPAITKLDCTMANDFGMLYLDEDMADIMFRFGESGKTIKAHKLILKARSRYFAALLAGGFSESGSKVAEIYIHDVSAEAFSKVLEYLYTNAITNVHEGIACECLLAASRYCLDGLLACCEIELKAYLNAENVGHVYELANECCADQLISFCKYFARKKHSQLMGLTSIANAECHLELARDAGLVEVQKYCEELLKSCALAKNSLVPLKTTTPGWELHADDLMEKSADSGHNVVLNEDKRKPGIIVASIDTENHRQSQLKMSIPDRSVTPPSDVKKSRRPSPRELKILATTGVNRNKADDINGNLPDSMVKVIPSLAPDLAIVDTEVNFGRWQEDKRVGESPPVTSTSGRERVMSS